MQIKIIALALGISLIFLASCASSAYSSQKSDSNQDRKSIAKNLQQGKLVNMENLDGCGWVILLENGNKIQPINLNDFEVELVNEKLVLVSYKSCNMMTICQVGEVVEIEYITAKK